MEITSFSLDLAAVGGRLRAKGILPQIGSKFYFGGNQLMGSSESPEDLVSGTGQSCLISRGSPEQLADRKR